MSSEVINLRSGLDEIEDRMDAVELQMRSCNAHLDNISRASDRTNDLLGSLLEQFRRREDRDDRAFEAELAASKDGREVCKSAIQQVWDTTKQPLAYALMAVATWFAIAHLSVQPQQVVEAGTYHQSVP